MNRTVRVDFPYVAMGSDIMRVVRRTAASLGRPSTTSYHARLTTVSAKPRGVLVKINESRRQRRAMKIELRLRCKLIQQA